VKEERGKFGYFNNYLIDTDHAVIVDVEAAPARLAQEIIATKVMLERVEETHHLRPERLAADKAYGTGPFLGWLSKRTIIPHIPVLDRQHQTDGLPPREAFTFDPDRNHYTCPQSKNTQALHNSHGLSNQHLSRGGRRLQVMSHSSTMHARHATKFIGTVTAWMDGVAAPEARAFGAFQAAIDPWMID
jgi:hypothetical protein